MRRIGASEARHFLGHSDESEEVERAVLKTLLIALKTRDADTYDHSKRTVKISLLLGRECGLDYRELRALEFGALLHDIGKIGVPDVVLRKPGKLNDFELAMMRRHPSLGQEILRGFSFLDDARIIVAQHHEKWDGSGYPLGLRGEEITLSARVLLVADAFDAMTTDRVYRPAKSFDEAAAELDSCAGTDFDPGVVAAFHRFPRSDWERLTRGKHLSAVPDYRPGPPATDGFVDRVLLNRFAT
ncbi:MAG: HD-GYP domain-containing protein [Pyrinomonadaceae bacterium]|nr:HD-GYP domain-containing protein [Pyrinomonadaceae bacterium]